ncbi:MAG: tetratricopeptide repeat protein [Cyanobacteria bacterium RM1_2_2]|nr:tetratricopeptide repeat protein [Cyanobacteria bacterium RM1_2_2]
MSVHHRSQSWSRLGWSGLLGLVFLETISLTFSLTLISPPALAQVRSASVQAAYALLDQGLVNQAIVQFEQILQSSPNSVDAQLGLAIAYRRAGRIDDAFSAYGRVLILDPNNRLALSSLGVLGGFRPEWQERGIEALTYLLELEPGDTEARSQRALLYGYQGRFGAAIADYEIVLRGTPTPEALVGAAEVFAYSGDYDRSLDLFSRYQERGGVIRGGSATAYAVALRETGNSDVAIQILERELRQSNELDGITIRQRAELAVNYAAIDQINQALDVLEPLRGRRDSRMILSRSLIAIGRYSDDDYYTDEAIPLFEEVLSQERDYLTVSIGREIADVLTSFPQIEAQTYALEIYRQLIQQQPNDRSFQIAAAVQERELGLVSAASLRDQVEAALQPLPADPYQQSVTARSLVRLENPDPSLQPYYEYLAEAGVNEPRLYFRIAQMELQQGDYAAAEAALATYTATANDEFASFRGELLLAEADRQRGDLAASASRYEAIVTNNPAEDEIVNSALQGLAGIRQSQGRLPEAVALYDELIARNPGDAALPLGRTSLAYQAGLISEAEAQAALDRWLTAQPSTNTPPELYSLVAALPPNAQRESLYLALLDNNPDDTAVQVRYVQVLAQRDPAAAQAYLDQLVARDPNNPNVYFVQAQLAQERGNLRQAGQAYQAVLDRNPSNIDALAALGGIRFQQRRYDRAEELYNEVLALEPGNRVAQGALIDLEVAQGNRLDALQQIEQLQVQRAQGGIADPTLARQAQRIEEGFLQQRGFQPPWERY